MNKQDQQHYIIHQHHLSDLGRIRLECDGWDSKDLEVEAYRSLACCPTKGSEKFEARFWRFYSPAMRVVAKGLDGVFEAGNGYGQFADQVQKIGKAFSCSVGDIIQLGGLFWMVDGEGFAEVSAQVVDGQNIVLLLAECERIQAENEMAQAIAA